MNNYVEQTLKTKSHGIWSCNTTYDQQVITQQGEQLKQILWPCGCLHLSMRTSADIRIHPCGRLHPSMRTSASIHADVRTNPCGRPHRCPQRCPQMSALMSADVRRLPRTSLRTTADQHMEILRTSAQKKFPACVDLRTKRPNTPQTSAGKCPQFSMRNITFFADISGTGKAK